MWHLRGGGRRCSGMHQPGFGQLPCDQCHQPGHKKGGGDDEPVIAGGIHGAFRGNNMRRFRGQPGQGRVHRPHQQVGAEAAGDGGKGGGDTGDGGASSQLEYQPGQGNEYHIAGVHGQAGEHAGKRNGEHQGAAGCAPYQAGQAHGKQAGLFCHPQPQHGDEHHAQWSKAGEVAHQGGEQVAKAISVEQRAGGNGVVGQGVDGGDIQCAQKCGERKQQQAKPDKQQGGVGQSVAQLLQPSQPAMGAGHEGFP